MKKPRKRTNRKIKRAVLIRLNFSSSRIDITLTLSKTVLPARGVIEKKEGMPSLCKSQDQ